MDHVDDRGSREPSHHGPLFGEVDGDERYRILAEHLSDVVWTMSPTGEITYVSPAVERVRGFTAAEAMVQPLDEILLPESQAESLGYYTALAEAAAAGDPLPSYRGEQAYLRRDGSIMWADVSSIPVVDAEGNLVEILGVSRDISAVKEKEAQLRAVLDEAAALAAELEAANVTLRHLATTDPLTGVWNRRHFHDVAESAIAESRRYGTALSVLLFDLDHFKAINDRHGHQVGDDVLIEVTNRVRPQLRDVDVLARWGGEEFLVLLPQSDLDAAVSLALRLRHVVCATPVLDAGTVTASIGLTQLEPGDGLDQLVKRSDDAVYAAKENGRDGIWSSSSTGMHQHA